MRRFAMEYRCPEDDAWYDVNFVCSDGESLTISYANFSEMFDETFDVERFKTLEELMDFEERFRPTSIQTQDHECRLIVQGKKICASHTFENGELKFYDAIVVDVHNGKHIIKQGEELCDCKFVLSWQHGPLKDAKKLATISNICMVPSGTDEVFDPELITFLKTARTRVGGGDDDDIGFEDTGYEEAPDVVADQLSYLEAIYTQIGKRRKFRSASRTFEGRLNGGCKKTRMPFMDKDEDDSASI